MKKTFRLSEPLTVGERQITEVELRRCTIGDEEDAMQAAIRLKKGNNPLTVEMFLMAKSAKLPYDAVRSMGSADYRAMREAMQELNGIPPANEDENPTTQTSG